MYVLNKSYHKNTLFHLMRHWSLCHYELEVDQLQDAGCLPEYEPGDINIFLDSLNNVKLLHSAIINYDLKLTANNKKYRVT